MIVQRRQLWKILKKYLKYQVSNGIWPPVIVLNRSIFAWKSYYNHWLSILFARFSFLRLFSVFETKKSNRRYSLQRTPGIESTVNLVLNEVLKIEAKKIFWTNVDIKIFLVVFFFAPRVKAFIHFLK